MNYKSSWILLCLSILLITGCKENADSIVVGPYINCATHGGEVSCWSKGYPIDNGNSWHFKVNNFRKKYVEPSVTVGSIGFCVLDQNQVECYSLIDEFKVADVPQLSNPYEIAAGSDFICALDDTGLACWGDGAYVMDDAPVSFDEPRNLVAGLKHICLQDNNGFDCYGFSFSGLGTPTPPSFLTNPTLVTASPSSDITCAQQDAVWTCWHNDDPSDAAFYFDTPDADLVVPGAQQTCALKEGEVICKGYGVVGPTGVEVPDIVENPTHLDIAGVHACVIATFGVHCWAPEHLLLYSPTNVPHYLYSSTPPQI